MNLSHFFRNGSALTLVVLLLPILILFLGFGIDYANLQRYRTELRRATDLSAKAAALVLAATDDTAAAEQAARDTAARNLVGSEPLELAAGAVEFGSATKNSQGGWDFVAGGTPINAVRVDGARTSASPDGPISTFFGSFYGRSSFDVEFSSISAFSNADICLVLDRSSSMKLATTSTEALMDPGDPRMCALPYADSRWVALEQAVSALTDVMNSTLSNEQVAVVTFASDSDFCGEGSLSVTTDQPLSTDMAAVNAALNSRSNSIWGGMTDVAAGIQEARNILNNNPARDNATKIIVVLTDGQYTEEDPVTQATLAANDGLLIYTVTFSSGANQTDMQNLAVIGSGKHYHANSASELTDAFRELGGSITKLIQ